MYLGIRISKHSECITELDIFPLSTREMNMANKLLINKTNIDGFLIDSVEIGNTDQKLQGYIRKGL